MARFRLTLSEKFFLIRLRFAYNLPYFCASLNFCNMNKVQRIVVHCTSDPANAVRSYEYFRHLFFDIYKWKHFGYHAVVYQNGDWERLQAWPAARVDGGFIDNLTMANGAKGYNADSLHVAYVGGLNPTTLEPTDTRTQAQKETLRVLIATWLHRYNITEVVGHRDLLGVHKACPCFDARKEYENV